MALALGVSAACAPAADTAARVPPGVAGGTGAPEDSVASGFPPDEAWLRALGTGPTQTARVCSRRSGDRIARALCADPAAPIASLVNLYRRLGLANPDEREFATTTHSLGLGARFVSAANPRTIVFRKDGTPIPYERFAVAAFARGEQVVELVGLDRATLDYNFYLLRFEQRCSASRCTPADLLTSAVEDAWTGWTLYSDADLEDTPLDCLSCHRPFGPGTPKQLLMRQTASPWLHWGDFRGAYEHRICPAPTSVYPGPWIPGDGLNLLVTLEGKAGRYAAIPVEELAKAPSGERFGLFLTEAENTLRLDRQPRDYPYGQLDFGSTEALCEPLETGTSPTWERQRRESLSRGLPVPFYGADVLDPEKRGELGVDRAGFLARHAALPAFEVAMDLIDKEVQVAVGFTPRSDDSAPQLFREMCSRCHGKSTEPRLRRARFDAESLESVEPAVARSVRNRIALPVTSPELMPPLRVGTLPPWAIERIETYLDEHCSDGRPSACR